MAPGRTVRAAMSASKLAEAPEVALAKLLDHIAAELAEEYVRLMEAAAAGDEIRAEQRALPHVAVGRQR